MSSKIFLIFAFAAISLSVNSLFASDVQIANLKVVFVVRQKDI